jgi:hypothetical protein
MHCPQIQAACSPASLLLLVKWYCTVMCCLGRVPVKQLFTVYYGVSYTQCITVLCTIAQQRCYFSMVFKVLIKMLGSSIHQ